jgi:two-component system sensor histidine kinase YesM
MYSNARIKTKVCITYVTLSLFPFLLVSAISIQLYATQTINTAANHTTQITRQVCDSIDLYISGLDQILDFLSLQLIHIVETEGDTFWESATLRETLSEIASSHSEIAGILIASESDQYISIDMTRISRDPFAFENWYAQARARRDGMTIISNLTGRNITTMRGYSFDDVFALTKAVFSPKDGRCIGIIMADVRHSIIRDSINRVPLGERGFMFIMDENGAIVYTQPNKVVYRISPDWLVAGDGKPFEVKLDGSRWQVYQSQSAYTGWKTVGVFSYDEVMGGVTIIFLVFVLSISVITVLLILFSFRLAVSLTRPISELRTLMRQAEKGDMEVRFSQSRSDELGDLGAGFNHMLSRMGELIRQVREEQRHRMDAEMKILQEQIKPHFLYNTLDIVSWMAREYQAEDIVSLVDALTTMFRIGLSTGKDFITLRDEIVHVSNYLYIQKIRYKEKLSYSIKVDQEALCCEVPKLILQPLVENAIYHGIRKKRSSGNISISARLYDSSLEMTVKDNGAGMSEETLLKIMHQMEQSLDFDGKQGFGLFYIQQRVKQHYGQTWGLKITSHEDEGTNVTVTLPTVNGEGPA